MSPNCYRNSSLETATVYKECLKHMACKEFVTNAEKSSLESVFCICGCYNKDHRKVELSLHPTKPSSSVAVVNTALPPPPPPTHTPPQPRPLLVYTRRKATGVRKVEKKEEVERVVEMTEWTIGETKTRVRTSFSFVQKEKIREYAEKVKWRVLKKDDDKMIRLCSEIGITPDMCKNWITNNKKRHGHGQSPPTFSL